MVDRDTNLLSHNYDLLTYLLTLLTPRFAITNLLSETIHFILTHLDDVEKNEPDLETCTSDVNVNTVVQNKTYLE